MKYFKLKRPYTHQAGVSGKLTELPEGTMIYRHSKTKGLEYGTVSYGNDPQYFLDAAVVEKNPDYFELVEDENFNQVLDRMDFKNQVKKFLDRGLTAEDMIDYVYEVEEESVEEENQPNQNLVDARERFYEELNRRIKEEVPYPPYTTYPQPIFDHTQCPCGNKGHQPCFSTACPKRMIVTYQTTTNPEKGIWVTNTTYKLKTDDGGNQ